MQYRKKPVVIDATQWFKNGDHPDDYLGDELGFSGGELATITASHRKENNWEGDVVRYYRHPGVSGQYVCHQCGKIMHDHGFIDTLEGGHTVCPGDWIVKGVVGEYYPVKPDVFELTYEKVV